VPLYTDWFGLWFMVFIFQLFFSYIVEVSFIGGETGISGENHRPVASHWQTLAHNVVSSTSRHERGSNSQL
jgi:hypothetical protein